MGEHIQDPVPSMAQPGPVQNLAEVPEPPDHLRPLPEATRSGTTVAWSTVHPQHYYSVDAIVKPTGCIGASSGYPAPTTYSFVDGLPILTRANQIAEDCKTLGHWAGFGSREALMVGAGD